MINQLLQTTHHIAVHGPLELLALQATVIAAEVAVQTLLRKVSVLFAYLSERLCDQPSSGNNIRLGFLFQVGDGVSVFDLQERCAEIEEHDVPYTELLVDLKVIVDA